MNTTFNVQSKIDSNIYWHSGTYQSILNIKINLKSTQISIKIFI